MIPAPRPTCHKRLLFDFLGGGGFDENSRGEAGADLREKEAAFDNSRRLEDRTAAVETFILIEKDKGSVDLGYQTAAVKIYGFLY
jgi:hypothetical protein